jgi:hypothetical protein
MVTGKKKVKIQLICKSAEHIEPLNLAFKQLASLHEWMRLGSDGLLERLNVLKAAASFHPDRKYDQDTRVLVAFGHLSGMWLQYEKLDFDPMNFKFYSRLGIAKGHNVVAEMGAVDHRKLALEITAQLAAFEGNALRIANQSDPHNALEIWRRLYWFTRFYRAWQRIGADFTVTKALQEKASKARAWKRDAWAYYLERAGQRKAGQSVSTVAANFVKQNGNAPSATHVEIYIGQRLALMLPRKQSNKKTVR